MSWPQGSQYLETDLGLLPPGPATPHDVLCLVHLRAPLEGCHLRTRLRVRPRKTDAKAHTPSRCEISGKAGCNILIFTVGLECPDVY